MAEEGTVVAVRPGEVDIELSRSEACASCGACAPGGGGMLMERVPVDIALSCGDRVSIEIAPGATARARWLVFVVPVAALVVGYLAGFLLSGWLETPADDTGALVALVCLAGSMISVAFYDRSRAADHPGDVRIHAIISQIKSAPGFPPGPRMK